MLRAVDRRSTRVQPGLRARAVARTAARAARVPVVPRVERDRGRRQPRLGAVRSAPSSRSDVHQPVGASAARGVRRRRCTRTSDGSPARGQRRPVRHAPREVRRRRRRPRRAAARPRRRPRAACGATVRRRPSSATAVRRRGHRAVAHEQDARRRVGAGRARRRPSLACAVRGAVDAGAGQGQVVGTITPRHRTRRAPPAHADSERARDESGADTPGALAPGRLGGPPILGAWSRSPLALAALATVAVPGLDAFDVRRPAQPGHRLRHRGRHRRRPAAAGWCARRSTPPPVRRSRPRSSCSALLGRRGRAGRLPFAVPRPSASRTCPRAAAPPCTPRSPASRCALEHLGPGPGLAASLGRAIAALHELPTDASSRTPACRSTTPATYRAAPPGRGRRGRPHRQGAARPAAPLGGAARGRRAVAVPADRRARRPHQRPRPRPRRRRSPASCTGATRAWPTPPTTSPGSLVAAPPDAADSIMEAYQLRRTELTDPHLVDRALLAGELALARWLLYGVRSRTRDRRRRRRDARGPRRAHARGPATPRPSRRWRDGPLRLGQCCTWPAAAHRRGRQSPSRAGANGCGERRAGAALEPSPARTAAAGRVAPHALPVGRAERPPRGLRPRGSPRAAAPRSRPRRAAAPGRRSRPRRRSRTRR